MLLSFNLAICLFPMLLSPSQELAKPERSRLRGRVLDSAGKPWVAAKVIINTRGIDDIRGFGDAEKLVVTTDHEGRFIAQLLPCRTYSAWAMTDLGKNRYRATSYYERVSAGQTLELREEGVFEQARFVVSGLEMHTDAGPFRIEATRNGVPTYVESVPVAKDGEYFCPPMPGGYRSHYLMGKMNTRLFYRSTTIRVIDPNAAVPAQAPLVFQPVKFGPATVIRVTAKETGKGLAGAKIYARLTRELHLVGTSDSEGFVVVPFQGKPYLRKGKYNSRLNLAIVANGRAITMLAHSVSIVAGRKAEVQLRQKKPDVTVALAPGRTIRGRILLAEGKPAAGMILGLYTAYPLQPRSRRYRWQFPILFKTDHEGRFDISCLNDTYVYRLLAAPNAEERRSLPRSRSYSTLPIVWLAGGTAPAAKGVELGDIRFDELAALDLRVRSFDASPAGAAALVLGEAGADTTSIGALYRGVKLVTDRRGRARVLARQGSKFAIASSHAGGQGLKVISPQDLSVAGAAKTMDLELSPTILLSGVVVDGNGKPVEGFTLRASYRGYAPGPRSNLTDRLLRVWNTKTANDGSFRIRVISVGQLGIYGSKVLEGGRTLTGNSKSLVLQGESIAGIEFVANRTTNARKAAQAAFGFAVQPVPRPVAPEKAGKKKVEKKKVKKKLKKLKKR